MQYIQLQPQLSTDLTIPSEGNYNLFLDINDKIIKVKDENGNIFKPLTTDVYISGGTYDQNTNIATFTNTTGGTFNVTGFTSDVTVTGGTYNQNTGIATFTNTTGGTFNLSGFYTNTDDIFVSGGTYDQNTNVATFTNTTGGTFSVTGFTSGGGGIPLVTMTKSELDAAILVSGLTAGQTYKITNVDVDLYGGTDVILQAVSNNRLSDAGNGIFYNPKYSQYDIWSKYMTVSISNKSGQFQLNEQVESDNGAIAFYKTDSLLEYISGDWSGATTITGQNSSQTADIANAVSPVAGSGGYGVLTSSNLPNTTSPVGMWAQQGYVFTVSYGYGYMYVYKVVSDVLTLVTSYDLTSDSGNDFPWQVYGDGSYLYVGFENGGIYVYEFDTNTETLNFKTSESINNYGYYSQLWGDGTYIYGMDVDFYLTAYQFNGTSISVVGKYTDITFNYYNAIFCQNGFVYIGKGDGGEVYSFTFDGSNFTKVAENITQLAGDVVSMNGDGDYIYFVDYNGRINAYSQVGSDLIFLNTLDISASITYSNTIWCYDGKIFITGGGFDPYDQNSKKLYVYTFDGTNFTPFSLSEFIEYPSYVVNDSNYLYMLTSENVSVLTYTEPIVTTKIWGGKVWNNASTSIGDNIDNYTLDFSWVSIPYNNVNYNISIDEIKYDYDRDMIVYRKDIFNNVVDCNYQIIRDYINPDNYDLGNPIKAFQWGNGLTNFGYGNGLYYFSDEDPNNNYISDGGNDMYDDGNFLYTNLNQIPYTHTQSSTEGPLQSNDYQKDGQISTDDSYFGTGSSYFTNMYPGLFVLAAENTIIDYFQVDGDNGADGDGSYDGGEFVVTGYTTDYTVYYKKVYGAGDPSINHIMIVNVDDSNIVHDYSTDTNNDYDNITNLSGVTKIYYMVLALSNGEFLEQDKLKLIVNNFLDIVDDQDINDTLSGLNSNYTNITSVFPVFTLEYSGVMNNYVKDSYFDCINFQGKYLYNNIIDKSQVYNNLFIDSYFSENQIVANSEVYNNILTDNSYIIDCIFSVNSNVNGNVLNNNSHFNNVTIEQISYINNNKLDESSFTNITLNNDSYFNSNILSSSYFNNNTLNHNSYFNNNILVDSYFNNNTLDQNSYFESNYQLTNGNISYNTLNQYGTISYNTINNSYIYYNTLTEESYINNNIITDGYIGSNILNISSYFIYNGLNGSSFNNNTLTNNSNIINNNSTSSYIVNNTLYNSSLDLATSVEFSNKTLQYNDIKNVVVNSDISAATIIFGDYTKNVFKRQDGTARISYYDNSDILVVTDITT